MTVATLRQKLAAAPADMRVVIEAKRWGSWRDFDVNYADIYDDGMFTLIADQEPRPRT